MSIAWWPGDVSDHLYPNCPHLRRHPAGSDAAGEPVRGRGSVADPFDSTVCGWCQKVFRARNKEVGV